MWSFRASSSMKAAPKIVKWPIFTTANNVKFSSRDRIAGISMYNTRNVISRTILLNKNRRSTLTTVSYSSHSSGGSGSGSSGTSGGKTWRDIWNELRKLPLQYATIPAVAAFVGLSTNWMGVKMLFYPIEYTGTTWYRPSNDIPYGMMGWQ